MSRGTHQITQLSPFWPNTIGQFFYDADGDGGDQPPKAFHATSGQLVITSSSPTVVRGTFTFTATTFSPFDDHARSVTAEGSFAALCSASSECR